MPATSYTLATMRAEIAEEVQDTGHVYYTAAAILRRINNRMADFTARTRCRRAAWSIDLVANQATYDLTGLTPRVIDIDGVACPLSAGSTDLRPLERMERSELECRYPEWRTETPSWPRYFARWVEGFNGILLHPRPSGSQAASVGGGLVYASAEEGLLVNLTGVGTAQATAEVGALVSVQFLVGALRLEGYAHSTDLANDSDSIEAVGGIPVQWQAAIKAGVLADLYGDLSVPIAQVEKAAMYEAEYEAAVQRAQLRQQTMYQSRPGTTGRARYV